MNKFTAEDARKLAGPSVDDHVEEALKVIKEQAEKKQHTATLHSDFWTRGGYSRTEGWKLACKKLTDLGFDVEFFYEERQFVNMYTLVKW